MGSLTLESISPLMMTNLFGWTLPRCMATILLIQTSRVRRRPSALNMFFCSKTSRQFPQSALICAKDFLIHLLAAPMPLVSESVSLKVWRVPKLAKVSTSVMMRLADTALIISYIRASCCPKARLMVKSRKQKRYILEAIVVFSSHLISNFVAQCNYIRIFHVFGKTLKSHK